MGKTFNMVGGGGSASFSATINVTNATPNEVVTATLLNTTITYIATASASGEAQITIGKSGEYVLTCNRKYSPNNINATATGAVYTAKMLDVPIAYQEVTFLQSTGTQYLSNLLSTFRSTYKYHLKANFQSISSLYFVFGINPTAGSSQTGLFINGNNLIYQHGEQARLSIPISVNTDCTIQCENGKFTVNSSTKTGTASSNFANSNLYLYRSDNGEASMYARAKIYYYKVYDSNDVLLLDLVPCYRKTDSVAGMWDKVSNSLFINSGTGTFTVGGDVT